MLFNRVLIFFFLSSLQYSWNNFVFSQQLTWNDNLGKGKIETPIINRQKLSAVSQTKEQQNKTPKFTLFSEYVKKDYRIQKKEAGFIEKLVLKKGVVLKPSTINIPDFSFKDLQSKNIQYLDKAHGFFSNTIVAVDQDKEGYIWVGSENEGIIKIFGKKAFYYNRKSGLLSNYTSKILADKSGKVWIGSDKGLTYIFNNQLYSIENPLLKNAHVRFITEDNWGNIWVTTYEKGFFKIGKGKIETYNKKRGLHTNSFDAIDIDETGRIHAASIDGYIKIESNKVETYQGKASEVLEFHPVSVKKIGNRVWVGSFSGSMFCVELNRLYKVKFKNEYERIFQIEETDQGIWFSDYGSGMILLKPDYSMQFFGQKEGLVDRNAYQFLVDLNNDVWVADPFSGLSLIKSTPFSLSLDFGKNITKYKFTSSDNLMVSHNGNPFTSFYDNEQISYNRKLVKNGLTVEHQWDFIEQENKEIWVCTHGLGIGVISKNEYNLFQFDKGIIQTDLTKDHEGNVWFSTPDAGIRKWDKSKNEFYIFSKNDGLSSNNVKSSFIDSQGKLWICTDNGIDVLHQGKLAHLKEKNGLLSNDINAVFEDSKKRIWIASNDAGVSLYLNGRLVNFDISNGLISDRIIEVFEDNHHHIWLITSSGLSMLKEGKNHEFSVKNFGVEYGSFMRDFSGGYLKLSNGNIFLGNTLGTIVFDPKLLSVDEKFIFNIQEISVNNKLLEYKNYIRCNSNDKVALKIDLLKWGISSKIDISYAIVGSKAKDTLWQIFDPNNIFELNHLIPGKFNLLYKIQNGSQTDIYQIAHLHIKTPWYRSFWFVVLIFLFLVILIKLFLHLRTKRLLNKQLRLEEIIQTKTLEIIQEKELLMNANEEIKKRIEEKDVLIYEMHHRVKNNLQTISSLIDMQLRTLKDPKEKSILTDTIRRMNAMSASHEFLYNVDDFGEINVQSFIKQLIVLQNEFLNANQLIIDIVTDIPTIYFEVSRCIDLAMIVNEAISNAYKHAFDTVEKPKIYIHGEICGNNFVLSVIDNGVGYESEINEEKNSLGIKLIHIFTKKLKGFVSIENANPGTKIIITIPKTLNPK